MSRLVRSLIFTTIGFLGFSLNIALADVDNIAAELVVGWKSGMAVAVKSLPPSTSGISKSTASSFYEKLTNSVQRAASSRGVTVVERSKLQEVGSEKEEFQNDDNFAKLVQNVGADVMVSLTLNRIDPENIEVSARSIGVKGEMSGKILSASKTYRLPYASNYTVYVASITQGSKDRKKYSAAVSSGLSALKGIEIVGSNASLPDYTVSVNFDFKQQTIETAASMEAQQQATGAAMANQIFGGAFGGLMKQNMEQTQAAVEKSKKVLLSVSAEAIAVKNENGSQLSTVASLEREFPATYSKDQLASNAKVLLNEVLEIVGNQVASKVLGKTVSSSGGGLLD
jgi:hypothetical protein